MVRFMRVNTIASKYLTKSEYRFSEDKTDDIVRVASYQHKALTHSVISFSHGKQATARSLIATSFERVSNERPTSFDRLPLELLQDVLIHLDMHSLFRFRQTSLRSRLMVDSLMQYQRVVSHGLDLLCALLRTRLAGERSFLEVYDALCTKACNLCGDFGGFISILTWTRCCLRCLQYAPETEVLVRTSTLRSQMNLDKAETDQLRSFRSLPGIYTRDETVYKSRYTLISGHQARLLTGQQTGLQSGRTGEKFRFMGSCALPYYDKQTETVHIGMSCAGCQLYFEKTKEYAPKFGEKWLKIRDTFYTQEGFLKHFRRCPPAQLLWELTDEGKSEPLELSAVEWQERLPPRR